MRIIQLIPIIVIILLTGCKTEERLVKSVTPKKMGAFNNDTANHFTGNFQSTSGPQTNNLLLKEIMQHGIPLNVPNESHPDWQSYYTLYLAKKSQLSEGARLHCTKTLLFAYPILAEIKNSTTKNLIIQNLNLLTEKRYNGYKNLYNTLVLLKAENEKDFVKQSQAKILAYAKPVLGATDPNLKNSPVVDQNPKLKEGLIKMINEAKENDGYIEKIRSL